PNRLAVDHQRDVRRLRRHRVQALLELCPFGRPGRVGLDRLVDGMRNGTSAVEGHSRILILERVEPQMTQITQVDSSHAAMAPWKETPGFWDSGDSETSDFQHPRSAILPIDERSGFCVVVSDALRRAVPDDRRTRSIRHVA